MGLTDNEARRVWEKMAESEVRSLYFADLASRYTKRKQIFNGIAFFLSSGAAATVLAKMPNWVPIGCSLVVALLIAYTMAVDLDGRIRTLSSLHYRWNQLTSEYEHLWNHWQEQDASDVLARLQKDAREASETATEMPYNEDLITKWSKVVYSRLRQQTVPAAA